MRRVLVIGLAVLSAVLFVAAGRMWVRSCYVIESVDYGFRRFSLTGASGPEGLGILTNRVADDAPLRRLSYTMTADEIGFQFTTPSLRDYGYWGPAGGRAFQLLLPYWFLLILFSIAPPIRWRMGRRMVAAGVCQQCGYDLRATPERCPECGAVSSVLTTSA